jgi:hypothetical protein
VGRLEAALLRESASAGAEAGLQEPEQPAADAGTGDMVKADEVRGTLRSVLQTPHARVHTLCAYPSKVRAGSALGNSHTWHVRHPDF